MTDDDRMKPCMVCTKPSTLRCGGCKGEREAFCSAEHQKLSGVARTPPPVHATVRDLLDFPPLTDTERRIFLETNLQEATMCLNAWPCTVQSRMTFGPELGAHLAESGLCKDGWMALLKQLGAQPCPIPEPRRSHLLATLRAHALPDAYNSAPAHLRPWYQLSAPHGGIVSMLNDLIKMSNSSRMGYRREREPEPEPLYWEFDAFTGANSFYRALLLFYHLLAAVGAVPSAPRSPISADILLAHWHDLAAHLASARFASEHKSWSGLIELGYNHRVAVEYYEERLSKDVRPLLNEALEKLGRKDLCVAKMEESDDEDDEDA